MNNENQNEEIVNVSDDQNVQDDYKNKWLRAQADYQNLQKEISAQRSEWVRMSEVQIIEEFLPVFDNFKTAFAHKENLVEDKDWINWSEGIGYIMKQFEDILHRHGVEIINTVGENFNPEFHEAVSEETTDEMEAGKVLKEIAPGYVVGKKVLRAAKVIISKK